MNLSFGYQTAQLATASNQSLSAAPVIDGSIWPVPTSPSSLTVLLTGQANPKENGLYTVSKVSGVITWAQQPLTAPRVHVQVNTGTAGGLWAIVGTPVYGTDDVTVSKL